MVYVDYEPVHPEDVFGAETEAAGLFARHRATLASGGYLALTHLADDFTVCPGSP